MPKLDPKYITMREIMDEFGMGRSQTSAFYSMIDRATRDGLVNPTTVPMKTGKVYYREEIMALKAELSKYYDVKKKK